MRKNELRARSAVKRDLAAIALPTKLQLQKIISELQNLVYSALRTGETTDIEKVCQERLLALLDAGTEVAVLKGGRRGQLSSEKVIDEPISEIMPVRFSLQDKGTVQAQGTAKYLRRISGIAPTRTNNEFRKQNAVLINGLSKEICDTVRKTIVDLTKLGVHVRGGKKEISDILLNAGLDPAATPRLAETIFRTQTAAAYNAGRWNIVNDSDTAPYIWGFQYCTAHDRRVRPEHRLLEGVRLPKDDPFWKRYFPPNGWNCRCTVLEIWNDEETACEDFGITGVDPRKRSPKELNLLPAFDGNAGILGYGRGGSGGGIKDNIPASPKPSGEKEKEKEKVNGKKGKNEERTYVTQRFDVERYIDKVNETAYSDKRIKARLIIDGNGYEFVIKDEKNNIVGRIKQKGVSFSTQNSLLKLEINNQVFESQDILEIIRETRKIYGNIQQINQRAVLIYWKKLDIIHSVAAIDNDVAVLQRLEQNFNSTDALRKRYANNANQYQRSEPEIKSLASQHGMTEDDYIEKCNNTLKKLFDDYAVCVRTTYEVAQRIIGDNQNGIPSDRFKTQFETLTSNGSLSFGLRSNMENSVFGYEKYNTSKPQDFRPIYGTILPKNDLGNQLNNPKSSLSATRQYGMIIFQLKDSVKGRTTWSDIDSLRKFSSYGKRKSGYGLSTVKDPTILSIMSQDNNPGSLLYAGTKLVDVLNSTSIEDITFQPGFPVEYLEAQIHGGVSFSDVEKIWVGEIEAQRDQIYASNLDAWDRFIDILQRLKGTGIPCEKL